jgi:hypothetical protein
MTNEDRTAGQERPPRKPRTVARVLFFWIYYPYKVVEAAVKVLAYFIAAVQYDDWDARNWPPGSWLYVTPPQPESAKETK